MEALMLLGAFSLLYIYRLKCFCRNSVDRRTHTELDPEYGKFLLVPFPKTPLQKCLLTEIRLRTSFHRRLHIYLVI